MFTARRRRSLLLALGALGIGLLAWLLLRPGAASEGPEPLTLQQATGERFTVREIARGFESPVWAGVAPGDEPGALWVAERGGKLLRASGPQLRSRALHVDLSSQVSGGPEQGLLGVAFLPDFARTQQVVLSYTNPAGDSRIELWRLGATVGEARRLRTLLTLDQPFPNHNGGHVEFGAHHTLYTGFGDGGGAGDPKDRAQDPRQRFGKILAADLQRLPARGEPTWRVVATGLRNPWRFWIDPALGEMWIGDVGQDLAEEIDRISLDTSTPVANLGWSAYEGHLRFRDRKVRGTPELTWPAASYAHERGRCSVTGGLIYRGRAVPALRGRYLFGDFCTGELMTVQPGPGTAAKDLVLERAVVPQLAHLGLLADGEVVAVSLDGTLWRVER